MNLSSVLVECVLGANWVVTAHEEEIEVLEEFRERAEGGSQAGALDSPSFVAAAVEWVVTSYFRAFEEIEGELEELDAKVMSDIPKNVSEDLASARRAPPLHRDTATCALSPSRGHRRPGSPRARSAVDRGFGGAL